MPEEYATPSAAEVSRPVQAWLALDDDRLLERMQQAACDYFMQMGNPRNGLVADTTREGSPSSIAVTGFALSCYPIAVEHGWMTRAEALHRSLAALRFFHGSDQGGGQSATGYKGFYYHFLDMHSGGRVWSCELSMIDTALLLAGMLLAREYFDADVAGERELRELADALYLRVDWCWAQGGEATLRQGWKPECGFLHYGWDGYNEAIVLYALAAGSPGHPVTDACYRAWTLTYQWENLYGHDLLYAGPMFVHHYSHAWIDFRGIRDRFMREKRCDYFENSRRATLVQREYARRNPHGFAGYGESCWGLSACDGPAGGRLDPVTGEPRRLFGYAARGVPYGPDDGSVSAPAVLASLPFAPALSLGSLRHMLAHYPETLREGRLAASFNPSLADAGGRPWVSDGHYGLDQGIVAMMIENHRSGLPWRLMRRSPWLVRGLLRAGFRGGWLDEATDGTDP
ncbi:glucoamylase family protein [Fulvimonas sp. R45]|uniref:glucoamylase family protein n=1 Tax=Fulvimonas sp. R45 TaxID=3045937 RepID=UPI00265ED5FB|nr:glucoamylase family protein [Fulvimonas sp. R45]MDO1528749.1 glucoamylase family protein [Fulvimonas sp. R45]